MPERTPGGLPSRPSHGLVMLGDRRRPGMPAELVGRVLPIAFGVIALQLGGLWLQGWFAPVSVQPNLTLLPIAGQGAALVLLFLLIGRIAYRFFDVETAGLACLAAAMALPLAVALRPVAINPLAWQSVALLLALNGLTTRESREGGMLIGAGLALATACTSAGTLLALGVLALCAGKWLRNRAERGWLVHALQTWTCVAGAICAGRWAFDLGTPAFAPLAALAWATVVVRLLSAFEPHPRALNLGGFGAAVAGAVAIVGSWPGSSLATTLGLAAPQPLWSDGAAIAIQALGLPLVALAGAIHLFGRSGDWLRRWWFDYSALLALAIMLAMIDARVAPAACALAAVPLGWQLREWGRAVRNTQRHSHRALALAGFAAAMVPALPLAIALPSAASATEAR